MEVESPLEDPLNFGSVFDLRRCAPRGTGTTLAGTDSLRGPRSVERGFMDMLVSR